MPIYNVIAPFALDGNEYAEGAQIELTEEAAAQLGAGLLQTVQETPTQPENVQPESQPTEPEQPATTEPEQAPAPQDAPVAPEEPAAGQGVPQEPAQAAGKGEEKGWAGNHKV